MVIQNGTIEFAIQEVGAIDPETGYRSKPSPASWGDPIACNIQTVKLNKLARTATDGRFTEKSYEVFVEDDTPITSERVRLKDLSGKELGIFSVSQVVPLEAVGMIRILV